MKKLYSLAILAVALMLASCSDYTDVIPAEATLLGRGDIAAMQDQTGIDLNKLFSDMADAIQEQNDDFPDMDDLMEQIDLSEPVYWFAAGDMAKAPYIGVVIKVNDSEELVDAIDKALLSSDDISKSDLKKLKKDEDGFITYQPRNEHTVVGVSNNALLILVGPESSDKKVREKAISLLSGEEKGIKDNELYSIMDDHDAFASVYVSMEIVPDAAWKVVSDGLKSQGIRLKTSQLKTMMFGLDASGQGSVLDLNFWYKSTDDEFQEKLDSWLGCLKVPTDDGFQVFTSDVMGGFAANFDGETLAKSLSGICSTFGISTSDIPNYDQVVAALKKIDGNILAGVTEADKTFFVAQTANINDIMMQMQAPEYVGHEGSSRDDFDYYDRPYYDLSKNGTEYVKIYTWGNMEYFGYRNGFSYLAEFDIAGNVLDDEADIPASLQNALMNNRATIFCNLQNVVNKSFSRSERETVEDACSEFLDNVEYLTFSLK